MSKETAMEALKNAKAAHKRNMQKVLLLSEGMPLQGDAVAVDHESCEFGKWLYGDPNAEKAMGGILFPEIEKLHRHWHEEYHRIYEIYYEGRNKPGMMSKLFGSRPKLTADEKEEMLSLVDELKEMTWTLTKKLETAERRLEKMPDNCC